MSIIFYNERQILNNDTNSRQPRHLKQNLFIFIRFILQYK